MERLVDDFQRESRRLNTVEMEVSGRDNAHFNADIELRFSTYRAII